MTLPFFSTSDDPGPSFVELLNRVKPTPAPVQISGHEPLQITHGTTVLGGPVADQSALHGLLRKVSDLGLPLVSVTPTDQHEPRSTP